MIYVTGAGDEYRNLLNGIITILANDYVTNGINANPETKLMYGQLRHQSAIGLHDLQLTVMLTLLFTHLRVSYSYTLALPWGAEELMCGKPPAFRSIPKEGRRG